MKTRSDFALTADLRSMLAACRRLLTERGEAMGPVLAAEIIGRFTKLAEPQRTRFFDRLASEFNPEPGAVLAAAQAYAEARDAERLIRLTRLTEPPRQELFRRLNRAPGGTAAIVSLRHAMLDKLARHPGWRAVEADLLHLLSSWFTRASWRCGASTGIRRRSCSRRSSTTRRCTRSTVGTICGAACSPTGAASPSSTPSCPMRDRKSVV